MSLFVRESTRATTSPHEAPVDQTPVLSAARIPHGGYAILVVATTLFVAGSTCTMLFPFASATQTARGEAITLVCSAQQAPFGPTRIVATTRFVAGSIRETLGPPAFATQTAPGETAMPSGFGPTGMVAVTVFVAGSTRVTMFKDGLESQTAPSPAAAASGVPTLILATMTFLAGSIRMSVALASLIAQTAPSPTANGPPPLWPSTTLPRPMRIPATTLPPGGSAGAAVEPVGPFAFFASKTEPTIAATSDARTTASRNRRRAEDRAGAGGAVIRSS